MERKSDVSAVDRNVSAACGNDGGKTGSDDGIMRNFCFSLQQRSYQSDAKSSQAPSADYYVHAFNRGICNNRGFISAGVLSENERGTGRLCAADYRQLHYYF